MNNKNLSLMLVVSLFVGNLEAFRMPRLSLDKTRGFAKKYSGRIAAGTLFLGLCVYGAWKKRNSGRKPLPPKDRTVLACLCSNFSAVSLDASTKKVSFSGKVNFLLDGKPLFSTTDDLEIKNDLLKLEKVFDTDNLFLDVSTGFVVVFDGSSKSLFVNKVDDKEFIYKCVFLTT